ncbi:hypothetical protein TURU_098487 [Turdus rufiventris]|nr:hypothetical protein TURU_098487 [Turdus rufiventris]
MDPGGECIKRHPILKEVLGGEKQNQQSASTAQKANVILDSIKRGGQQGKGGDCPPLLLLCGTSPGCHIQHMMDVELSVQRRAMKMIRGLEHLSYEDGLRESRLISLEKERVQEDHTAAFQYLKRTYRKDGEGLSTRSCTDRTRKNGFKLEKDN